MIADEVQVCPWELQINIETHPPGAVIILAGLCVVFRLVLVILDFTRWPNDSAYVQGCLQALNGILSMSPSHSAALVTYPLPHEQTLPATIVKNRRKLEDFCLSSSLDVMGQVMITYAKPPGTSAADKRSRVQNALFLTSPACQDANPWLLSEAFRSQILKDIPLIRVSDMVGYDEQNRPSPAARVEQTLGLLLF